MKNSLANLSVGQLKKAIGIREKIEMLMEELEQILGGKRPGKPGRRKMSAAGRAAIAAGARKRWAKARKGGGPGRRKMSPAARAKIAAAARERWKKAKAAGKNTL